MQALIAQDPFPNRKAPSIPATTDLKVNNLPYDSTVDMVRGALQDFDISKIVIKEGYAFVGVASAQVQLAVQKLNGTMVGNRVITVKLAERRK